MSKVHLARSGFITKAALPSITRQRGTTTASSNLMLFGAGKTTVANNTTFIDSSANAFTITRNGDTVHSGHNPFSTVSDGSGYFDGNGDYLSIPDNTALNMGTSDFTIECFIYLSSAPGIYATIIDKDGKNAVSWPQYALYVNNNYRVNLSLSSVPNTGGNPTVLITGATTLALNTWYHVAATRSGTSATLWLNGVSDGTSSSVPSTLNNGARPLLVGWEDRVTADTAFNFPGYISNLRVVKGTAVYTSTFTPPTSALTAITNTQLLLLTDNYSIVNSTPTPLPVTINGNTTISTAQYPTGMTRSIYFDGTGDYLSIVSNSTYNNFGTGDFTIESWFYISGNSPIIDSSGNKASAIFSTATSSGNGYNIEILGSPTTTGTGLSFQTRQGGSQIGMTPTLTVTQNAWHHVAVVRSGTTTYMFLDGTQVASTVLSNQTIDTTNPMWIGLQNFSGYTHPFVGYISNFRIVKGTAVYTSSFTPSAPLSVSISVPNNVTNAIYGVNQLA